MDTVKATCGVWHEGRMGRLAESQKSHHESSVAKIRTFILRVMEF